MPFCPVCRAEFRPGFSVCGTCQVALRDALPEQDDTKGPRLREAARAGETVAVVRGPYQEAAHVVETLGAGGIEGMMVADPATPKGAPPVYFVLILPEDAEAARATMRADWNRLVEHGGGDASARDAELNLDEGGELHCPACDTVFTDAQECPDCGLFLGGD